MKLTRLLLVALTLSLAACGSDITGPETSPRPEKASLGIGLLGSGT